MKIENQVVCLELAKKMQELGFKQESTFYWADTEDGEWALFIENKLDSDNDLGVGYGREIGEDEDGGYYAAYTVAELGEMLPDKLPIKAQATDYSCSYDLIINKLDEELKWLVSYCGGGDSGCEVMMREDNLADACAEVLIHLKENGLL